MTVVSVRAHLLALMDERDRRYHERFDAQELARTTYAAEMDKRLAGINELRGVLNDYQARLMNREEYAAAHNTLVARLDDLAARLAKAEGSATGARGAWGYLMAVAGVVVAIVAVIFK